MSHFSDRFQAVLEQAKTSNQQRFERARRIVDGEEEVASEEDLLEAHHALAELYMTNGDARALTHAKEFQRLRARVSGGAEATKQIAAWVAQVERYVQEHCK